jgi:MFS transporter, DHA2 family, multidrug resistance protein
MHDSPAPRAGRREWIGLAVIALPCLLYAMDLTVLYLAVPSISADLQPTSSQLLWIVDIYGFLVAGFLVTMGTLGDRIGRRRLLLYGAAAFGVASVLTAFSTSAEMLIGARAVLGVAAATLAPSTLSLISNMFHDAGQRTFAIGVWVASFSAGAAIGPLVGGALLERFWWGSVFLIAVPVMLLLLVLGPLLLPEFRDPDAGRLDLLSAAQSLVTVLAVIAGLKLLAERGLGWLPLLSIVVGLAVGVLFVRRQQSLTDPLIDLRLFRSRAFSAVLTINVLDFFVGFGISLLIAQHLQLVLGLSPLQAGLWTLPASAGLILGSLLTPRLLRWASPGRLMAGGWMLAGLGFALLTQISGEFALAVIVAANFLLSLGLAPVTTLATDQIVGAVPPEQSGAAAAVSETSVEFGGALGIAVLGSIVTALYRRAITGTLPDGVSPEILETTQGTLGGAVAVAADLPGPFGAVVLASARAAFTSAVQAAAAICVVLALAAAIVAASIAQQSSDAGK